MRIPLSTSLKTRTGAPDKDARLTNAYVEVKGEQSVVRKRPIVQGGVSIGTGTAQGGIGFAVGGIPYIYTFSGDVGALDTLATAGTNWNVSTSYVIGDRVSVDFVDYWASADNTGSQPPNGNWSTSYVPAVPSEWSVLSTDYQGYNGSYNFTYSSGPGSTLGVDEANGIALSTGHQASSFAALVSAVSADALATTPDITGTFLGLLYDIGIPGTVVVSGTWTSALSIGSSSWDQTSEFEIDGSVQDIVSTSCTREDLLPNSTIIGNMGGQGENNAYLFAFNTRP